MIMCAHTENDDYYEAYGNASATNDEEFMQQQIFVIIFKLIVDFNQRLLAMSIILRYLWYEMLGMVSS